jgi:AcrR family transcriptional regulator
MSSRATRSTKTRVDRRSRTARAERSDAREDLLRAAAEVFSERGFKDASVDEIATRAGYSKGALYWHFESKDELFFALMDATVDAPAHEMIELFQSAPPERDMAPEGSRRFVELVRERRDLLLLEHEYWSQAVRDPELRAHYTKHRRRLRSALGQALQVRFEHLGTPDLPIDPEEIAAVVTGLFAGLAQQRLIDPTAVPDELFGKTLVFIYRGLLASTRDGAGPTRHDLAGGQQPGRDQRPHR